MPVVEVSTVEMARKELQKATGAIVAVPVYNAFDDCLSCFESLIRHTPESAAFLIVDDAGGDKRSFQNLIDTQDESARLIVLLHHEINTGFVGSCNDAFAAASTNDVILVNSDVVVGSEWYERLTEAAHSSNLIATASTLTNHGTVLSVPNFNSPNPQLPADHTPDSAAEAVAKNSLRLRPTISTAVGHCTYIKRAALDAVGNFDVAFGRGYGEEVDFSQRAVQLGFKNICADDVFTFHRGGGSFSSELSTNQKENEKIVVGRYPWYPHWNRAIEADMQSPLFVALIRAAIGLRGLSIAIDGRELGPTLMGTQQVIIETVRTLAQHPRVSRVVVYINGPIPNYAVERLQGSNCEFVRIAGGDSFNPGKCDIAYRPNQATSSGDINFLRKIGRWISLNRLDNIAFSNPTYFVSSREWMRYRDTARLSLACVDGVAYLSNASMQEALGEGLVPAGTSQKVVFTGTQFEMIATSDVPKQMTGKSGPFLFVLGASYQHKNRVMVLRAVAEMVKSGWKGTLVIAGPTPPVGSSLGQEAAEFMRHNNLREHVVQLPAVTDSQKRWLFENSTIMLYPTIVEGFGLIPFEAAQYGLASLSTRQGSLNEVLPNDIPTINSFSHLVLVDQINELLADENARQHIVKRILEHGKQFSAEATSRYLVEMFLDMTSRPPKRTVAIRGEDVAFTAWVDGIVPLSEASPYVVSPGFIVRLGWKMATIKNVVSPDESKRQDFIRKSSNRIRKTLKR